MPQYADLILVCGLPRSGTTHIGKALTRTGNIYYIHEPLNKDFGAKGVHCWYPFIDEKGFGDSSQDKSLIHEILQFNTAWTHTAPSEYGLRTHITKALYGGRSGLKWSLLRWRKKMGMPVNTICIKDPFATFSSGYFIQKFKARTVCLIRHPGSVYMSYKRQHFKTRVESLFEQRHFRSLYAEDIPHDLWEKAKNDICTGTALLWKLMSRYVDHQRRDTENFLLLKHEDFCHSPESMMEKICAFTQVPFGKTIKSYIQRNSGISNKANARHPVSGFDRDGFRFIHSWPNGIDENEKNTIQETIGRDFYRYYEKW